MYGLLSGTVQDPLLWTAETPYLYILVVSLYSSIKDAEKGIGAIDVETSRVGIRDIQITGMVMGQCLCVCIQVRTYACVTN